MSAFGLRSTVVLPCTSHVSTEPAFPFRVRIPEGVCGLRRDSDVVIDQILAWDNSLFLDDLGEVPEAIQGEVRRALAEFLDVEGPA